MNASSLAKTMATSAGTSSSIFNTSSLAPSLPGEYPIDPNVLSRINANSVLGLGNSVSYGYDCSHLFIPAKSSFSFGPAYDTQPAIPAQWLNVQWTNHFAFDVTTPLSDERPLAGSLDTIIQEAIRSLEPLESPPHRPAAGISIFDRFDDDLVTRTHLEELESERGLFPETNYRPLTADVFGFFEVDQFGMPLTGPAENVYETSDDRRYEFFDTPLRLDGPSEDACIPWSAPTATQILFSGRNLLHTAAALGTGFISPTSSAIYVGAIILSKFAGSYLHRKSLEQPKGNPLSRHILNTLAHRSSKRHALTAISMAASLFLGTAANLVTNGSSPASIFFNEKLFQYFANTPAPLPAD